MSSISLGVWVRPRWLPAVLTLSMLACCTHDGVVAFNVKPPLVCAGKTVDISWQVRGRALLKATPPPPDWKEQVASEGTLKAVPVTGDTTFTIVAPDANPARGASYASQSAQSHGANRQPRRAGKVR